VRAVTPPLQKAEMASRWCHSSSFFPLLGYYCWQIYNIYLYSITV